MDKGTLGVPVTRRRFMALLVPLAGAFAVACSGNAAPARVLLARPAENQWPDLFEQAKPEIQEAYRYALANPDVLQYFPCYCGCGEVGHISNRDCYIREIRPDGTFLLDPMSFG